MPCGEQGSQLLSVWDACAWGWQVCSALGPLPVTPKGEAVRCSVVCLYAVLAGARVSVLRALLMFTLASLSVAGALGWSQRRICEFVALVLMIANPAVGRSLSFVCATYGIIVLSSLWPRRRQDISGVKSVSSSVRTWLANTAIVSLGAQAGVVPILAFHFRSLPLIGDRLLSSHPLFVLASASPLDLQRQWDLELSLSC